MNRSSLRTRALQLADAVSSSRWDSTTTGATGEVDQHMGIVHSREWRRILNAAPYYRVAKREPTTDSTGRIAISALTSGSGDDAERFYRVLLLSVNDIPMKEVQGADAFMSTLTATGSSLADGVWFRQGDYLIVPNAISQTNCDVWVNHLPTRVDNLANDSSTVVFPDDYEDILAYEIAAILLSKGAAEVDAAAALKALAEDMRRDLLQDVARISGKPLVMAFPDSASEWGG